MVAVRTNIDSKNVVHMLRQALEREQNHWKPVMYMPNSLLDAEDEASAEARDGIVKWLRNLNIYFRFSPDTFFLSVSFLDGFLNVVKARPKYLRCIAVSCYFLAIKMTEEDEVAPTLEGLIEVTQCGFSISEVKRMERIILLKLSWNLLHATALDFLYLFHTWLVLNCSDLLPARIACSAFLNATIFKIHSCIGRHHLLKFKPSTVSLSLISLELESCSPSWFILTVALQRLAQVDYADLIRCREELSHFLFTPVGSGAFSNQKSAKQMSAKPSKRKMEQTELEDIYDSMKRLYGEEAVAGLKDNALPETVYLAEDPSPSMPGK